MSEKNIQRKRKRKQGESFGKFKKPEGKSYEKKKKLIFG